MHENRGNHQLFSGLIKLSKAIRDGRPNHHQSPYFILKSGNVISQFEFLTRAEYLNKLEKRKYFDMDIDLACQFEALRIT